MTIGPKMSRVLLVIGVLLVLPLAWTGVNGAIEQYPGIHSVGQQWQTAAQLALGVCSVLTIVVTFWVRRWRRAVFTVSLSARCWPVASPQWRGDIKVSRTDSWLVRRACSLRG